MPLLTRGGGGGSARRPVVTKDTVALANAQGANGSAQINADRTDRAPSLDSGSASVEAVGAWLHIAAAATEPTDKDADRTNGVVKGKDTNCAIKPESEGPKANPDVRTTPAITVPALPLRSAAQAVPAPMAKPAPMPTINRPIMSPEVLCHIRRTIVPSAATSAPGRTMMARPTRSDCG